MAVDEFGREIPAPSGGGGGEVDRSSRDNSVAEIPRHSNHNHHHIHHNHHHRGQSRSSNTPSRRDRRPPHPSFQYVEEPLLCEFVWKDQNKEIATAEESHKQAAREDGDDDDDEDVSSTTRPESPYDIYRRKYCLQYIRSFFNHHLDDVWFRNRYSPAARLAADQLEVDRSIAEARAILLQSTTHKTHFIANARLGGGTKSNKAQPAPLSHLFSWQQPDAELQALVISEIPPAVTDEQLWVALWNSATDFSTSTSTSTTTTTPTPQRPPTVYASRTLPVTGRNVLQRRALLVAPGLYDLYDAFTARPEHVPRKLLPDSSDAAATNSNNMVVDLTVDCTDPYNRLEYDADGRGGAPADGLSVPPKKAVVAVQKLSARTTPTAVLSAALSARKAVDAPAARVLADQLDDQKNIPSDCRLAAVLESLGLVQTKDGDEDDANDKNDANGTNTANELDALDVTIAYLRRVHLVSFYNGCDQPADAVADVLTSSKNAPASCVHLRLEQSDIIGGGEQQAEVDEDDLLVQRLETSITKALAAESSKDAEEKTKEQAAEIAAAQEKVQEQWLRDHSILDQDDRARCSFHFCHKLFKDNVFLHKHLLKKHVAYLQAEQAKCHDPYMMQAWDAAEARPVPDVLVDCGSRFGYVAAAVTGTIPDCVDPEPELWQREEERRRLQVGMRARRDEVRHQQQQQQREPAAPRSFVDVDDMKEEKVELSFDNVEVLPIKKKKKKKRKLL